MARCEHGHWYWRKRPQGHTYGNTYVVCSPNGMADGYVPPSASVRPPAQWPDEWVSPDEIRGPGDAQKR